MGRVKENEVGSWLALGPKRARHFLWFLGSTLTQLFSLLRGSLLTCDREIGCMSVSHHRPLPGQHWMGPSFPKSPSPSYLSTALGRVGCSLAQRPTSGHVLPRSAEAAACGLGCARQALISTVGVDGEYRRHWGQSCLGAMMGCPGGWAGMLGEGCGLGWT